MTISQFRKQHPELFKNAVDGLDWNEITNQICKSPDDRDYDLWAKLDDHFQSYIDKYLEKWPK